jgi:hypothetical protein
MFERVQFQKLKWAGHVVRKDNNRISKITEWKILLKKTCGKTVAEMGRLCQEKLLVVAEHRNREEVSTMQEHLETTY